MKNAVRRITDNACRRVWTFNYMNANERRRTHARTQTYGHGCRRMGTDADVWARTQHAHARTQMYGHGCRRMGTDADVWARMQHAHARTQMYGHGRRRTCTNAHVWARTQTYMHERTRMGTDADVHARTRTDTDVLWDLSAIARSTRGCAVMASFSPVIWYQPRPTFDLARYRFLLISFSFSFSATCTLYSIHIFLFSFLPNIRPC